MEENRALMVRCENPSMDFTLLLCLSGVLFVGKAESFNPSPSRIELLLSG